MQKLRFVSVVGLAFGLLAAGTGSAAADPGWEEVEVLPGDSTTCEFVEGVFTGYEVDTSALPAFDRQRLVGFHELPDGNVGGVFQFQRDPLHMLKVEPGLPGPDVIVESQRTTAVLRATAAPEFETLDFKGVVRLEVRTPDGELIDRNVQKLRGISEAGDPIVRNETGVCRP
jgi:hypothetical protein